MSTKNEANGLTMAAHLLQVFVHNSAFGRCISRINVNKMIFTHIIILMLNHMRGFQMSKATSWPSKSNSNWSRLIESLVLIECKNTSSFLTTQSLLCGCLIESLVLIQYKKTWSLSNLLLPVFMHLHRNHYYTGQFSEYYFENAQKKRRNWD